jgi:tetratricopeptide (TPR) repeat protein
VHTKRHHRAAGLLHNWGVGLYEMGAQAASASDAVAAASAFAEAASRLQASISFNRADTAPMNALGDVRLAQSELAADPVTAVTHATAAFEEGYGAALRVLGTDVDALIGTAEAHFQLARLVCQTGDPARVAAHLQDSYNAYWSALQRPAALGSLEDRCNARYNLACVCAQLGRAEEARELLRRLLVNGGTSREDLSSDRDLTPLRTLPWFVELIQ